MEEKTKYLITLFWAQKVNTVHLLLLISFRDVGTVLLHHRSSRLGSKLVYILFSLRFSESVSSCDSHFATTLQNTVDTLGSFSGLQYMLLQPKKDIRLNFLNVSVDLHLMLAKLNSGIQDNYFLVI